MKGKHLNYSQIWVGKFRQNLQENILKFWIDHAVDRRYDGMVGWLSREGQPILPGTKSLVQQARIVWTFAAAYRKYPEPMYKEVATHTLKFLRLNMFDKKNGGFYWLATREGRVVNDKKHLYGQSFAIYALAEYARAFGDDGARKEALNLFNLIDRKAHDDGNGGYREAFSVNWQRLNNDTTVGSGDDKSMNTHLHLLESFMALYEITGSEIVRERIEELIKIFTDKIVDAKNGYARSKFSDDWKPLNTNTRSYGHDIELSWLLTEAVRVLGRRQDPKIQKVALLLVDNTLRFGFDQKQGGEFYDGPPRGSATNRRKIWWVQAEVLVGLLNAYQLTKNPLYYERFEQQAQFVFNHFTDHKYGEWHNTIEVDGRIIGDKANEWKAPYHAGRACLEVIRRLEK